MIGSCYVSRDHALVFKVRMAGDPQGARPGVAQSTMKGHASLSTGEISLPSRTHNSV